MSMNKKMFLLFIFLLIITPTYKVLAKQKNVSVFCQCEYDGNNVTCPEKCSAESLKIAAAVECGGRESEIHSIKYFCNPYTEFGIMTPNSNREGTTPKDACQNYVSNTSLSVTDKTPLKVVAKATCTPKPEVLGQFICEEEDVLKTLTFLGYLLFFAKLLVPFILIIMGTMDYYKSIISNSSDDMKKQTTRFIKRVILGIMIFFIPAILNTFMVFVSKYSDIAAKYENCVNCALDPISCDN